MAGWQRSQAARVAAAARWGKVKVMKALAIQEAASMKRLEK
jgi:hypothetical protein